MSDVAQLLFSYWNINLYGSGRIAWFNLQHVNVWQITRRDIESMPSMSVGFAVLCPLWRAAVKAAVLNLSIPPLASPFLPRRPWRQREQRSWLSRLLPVGGLTPSHTVPLSLWTSTLAG